MLYRSSLDLLLALNSHERVGWSGPHRRRPLDALIVPRPEQPLKFGAHAPIKDSKTLSVRSSEWWAEVSQTSRRRNRFSQGSAARDRVLDGANRTAENHAPPGVIRARRSSRRCA
jgi:hypothetical protein